MTETETETFSISLEQAHAYDELFVPALFSQWVPTLLQQAGLSPGQSVLDVACGTGVVAREAAVVVGASGRVSGVDLNPSMIHVARERSPGIEWQVGDAGDLPYGASAFDVVLCQSALFFFPDPQRAVAEMARVVRPGGVVALQTYAGLDEQPAYGPFVDVVARHTGAEARRMLGTYWSKGDLGELRSLLRGAGLEPQAEHTALGRVTFPSVEAFVSTEVQATPLAAHVDEATHRAVVAETRTALLEHEHADGSVSLPIRARFVTARRPSSSG